MVYEVFRTSPTNVRPVQSAIRHGLLIAPITFSLAILIGFLVESFASFLGAGVPPPTPSLGNMLAEGRSYLDSAWWIGGIPFFFMSLPLGAFLAIVIPVGRAQERAKVAAQATVEGCTYAGFWRRLGAYFIDYILMFIVQALLIFLHGLLLYPDVAEPESLSAVYGPLTVAAIYVICLWLYFAGMESSSKQATLGKMALGIKVTDLQGNRISFWRATGRNFGKLVSVLGLGIGLLMVGFTAKKQGLHDKMAGCLVIQS